jgi:NADPH:quinone reductase-like Zn-dependent oxidoreductase
MKAVRIHAFGNSGQLKVEDAQMPTLGRGQVLVKIHEAGVNPVDWKIREGNHGHGGEFPLILGQDFAGEITTLGPQVHNVQVGDRVFGCAKGSYAEFAALDTTQLALIPSKMDYKNAAALPTPGLTAWQAIVDKGGVQKGQRVLVHGGGGSVGALAVQIAKWKGAHVFTTATSSEEIAYAKEIGAEQVIDYKKQNFEEVAKDIDLVLDTIGGDTLSRSLQILKPGGKIVTLVGSVPKGHEGQVIPMHMQFDADQLAQLADLVTQKILSLRLGDRFPLEAAAAAQDLVKRGHTLGKVLIHVT